eukprot:1792698-Rhodomonas_salina.1
MKADFCILFLRFVRPLKPLDSFFKLSSHNHDGGFRVRRLRLRSREEAASAVAKRGGKGRGARDSRSAERAQAENSTAETRLRGLGRKGGIRLAWKGAIGFEVVAFASGLFLLDAGQFAWCKLRCKLHHDLEFFRLLDMTWLEVTAVPRGLPLPAAYI